MNLRFDADLIEAVYLASQIADDPARDLLYAIADPQERDEAFSAHHAAWFRQAGHEAIFRSAAAEWPLLASGCQEAVVRRVRNPADEFAELFRDPDGLCRLGIGLRAGRVAAPGLLDFLRHEFCHISDMLDPAFGYPEEIPRDPSPLGEIRRERYRLLWDIRIDARLARRFPETPLFREQLAVHLRGFDKAFPFLGPEEKEAWLDALTRPDPAGHARLWGWAEDPRHLRGNASSAGRPGASCPVCGFTTFSWAAPEAAARCAEEIAAAFPGWSPEQGCCERCAEVYAAVGSAAIPPTVLLPRGFRARRTW